MTFHLLQQYVIAVVIMLGVLCVIYSNHAVSERTGYRLD